MARHVEPERRNRRTHHPKPEQQAHRRQQQRREGQHRGHHACEARGAQHLTPHDEVGRTGRSTLVRGMLLGMAALGGVLQQLLGHTHLRRAAGRAKQQGTVRIGRQHLFAAWAQARGHSCEATGALGVEQTSCPALPRYSSAFLCEPKLPGRSRATRPIRVPPSRD